MNNDLILRLHKNFEDAAKTEGNIAFWMARDIQPLLEYKEWRNFEDVIEKAKIACKSSEQSIENHFVDVNKMVDLGSGSSREIKDIKLTRYACYLIAQNGDPRKEAIAFAQSYFALQTRKQELLEERMQLAERLQARSKLSETEKQLSSTLYQHSVDDKGFAIIRSRGDNALFGGQNTAQMKHNLGIKTSKSLADFLPPVTLTDKECAAAITDIILRQHHPHGVQTSGTEHEKNHKVCLTVFGNTNIPSDPLTAAEDIHNTKRRGN